MEATTPRLTYKQEQAKKRKDLIKNLNGSKLVVSDEKAEEMVIDLYENFPEASQGCALVCIHWKYAKPGDKNRFKFTFVDGEDNDKQYIVNLEMAKKGFQKFAQEVFIGMLPGLSVKGDTLFDPCEFDAYDIDCLNQFSVFGEAIYG